MPASPRLAKRFHPLLHLWLRILLFAALFGAIAWEGSQAQPTRQEYFPETGHRVSGDFLTYYQNAKDPLLLFGYPITESFQDPTTGRIVQYFQRARFELYPNEPEELRVKQTPLGRYLYKPGADVPIPENFPACLDFPETGKQVCYAFLEFFNLHGRAAQFGFPISNFEIHDGRIVQYFQHARLEWHPEYPAGQRVTLTNLGSLYFEVRGENPQRLMAALDNNAPAAILSLRVRAFPKTSVAGPKGAQTVYVIVQDQNLQPVANAQATIVFRPPAGETSIYSLPLTNEHGIAQIDVPFTSSERGLAHFEVTVQYEDLEEKTVTSFRIWW